MCKPSPGSCDVSTSVGWPSCIVNKSCVCSRCDSHILHISVQDLYSPHIPQSWTSPKQRLSSAAANPPACRSRTGQGAPRRATLPRVRVQPLDQLIAESPNICHGELPRRRRQSVSRRKRLASVPPHVAAAGRYMRARQRDLGSACARHPPMRSIAVYAGTQVLCAARSPTYTGDQHTPPQTADAADDHVCLPSSQPGKWTLSLGTTAHNACGLHCQLAPCQQKWVPTGTPEQMPAKKGKTIKRSGRRAQ